MKLVDIREMRLIEAAADRSGLSYAAMMEHAGKGLAEEIALLAHPEEDEREVIGLIGRGNNGGDTLIALAHLAAAGWRVRGYLVGRQAEGDLLVERLKGEGGEIILVESDPQFDKLSVFIGTADVVVDGVLGTGFQLPLRDDVANVLSAVNKAIAELSWPPYVVAVDCPSGVNCDNGEAADQAIPASMTVCMAAVKEGLLKFPAFDLVGEVRVVDIGLSDSLREWSDVEHFVADEDLVGAMLPARSNDSHKGSFGTALIAAGSINYVGAPLLSGRAAYRMGTGLVQMAVPGPVHAAIAGSFPEATWTLLPHEMGVISAAGADVMFKNLSRVKAVLFGPGFGVEDSTKMFVENLLRGKTSVRKAAGRIGFTQTDENIKNGKDISMPTMVVDADGLRLLAKLDGWSKLLPGESILTPHPGEMAVLTGLEKEEVQSNRLKIALQYAAEWGHVVVLKGAFTVVASPAGRAMVIPVATSALAKAGTGDVLAGMIVGLLAQGLPAFDAAAAGAWVHAQAGLYAAEKIGSDASVLASDVVDAIADVMSGF